MDDKKKKQKSKRSVIPIYAIGAVWLLYIGKLGTIRGVISCAVVSAIVYAILRIVLPGSKQPEQAPEADRPVKARVAFQFSQSHTASTWVV